MFNTTSISLLNWWGHRWVVASRHAPGRPHCPCRQPRRPKATIDTQVAHLKKVHIIGAGAFHTTPQNEEKFLQLIAENVVKPIIARTMPVEQAAEAHRLQQQGEHQGKIVLVHG